MKNNKKIFVITKEVECDKDYDYDCYGLEEYTILAVCDSPQKALEIMEKELEYCEKKRIPNFKCKLYVEVFDGFNKVKVKDKSIFNIFKFRKLIKTFF